MKCPNCNHENPDSNKFCAECGTKLEVYPSMIECIVCHSHIPADSQFCPDCGTKVLTSTNKSVVNNQNADEYDKGVNTKVVAYFKEWNLYHFLGIDGKVIEDLNGCSAVKNELCSGEQTFGYYANNEKLFRITSSQYVEYGDVEDSMPLNNDYICIQKDESDKFIKLYDKYGIEQKLNFKTSCILGIINEYYLAMIGVDRLGLVNISDGTVYSRVDFNEYEEKLIISPKHSLIICYQENWDERRSIYLYSNIRYYNIESKSWVNTGVRDVAKKISILDDNHILLKREHKKWEVYDISKMRSIKVLPYTRNFGEVITSDDCTVYLPTNKIYNHESCMQIGHYVIIDDTDGYGLLDLISGKIVVSAKYERFLPVFNETNTIRYICFNQIYLRKYRNDISTVIFDIENGTLKNLDYRHKIEMITQNRDKISLVSENGMSMIIDQKLNVIYEDNWAEYNCVFPMNGQLYFCKDGLFGILKDNEEKIIIKDETIKFIVPLYKLNMFLTVSDKDIYRYIDISTNSIHDFRIKTFFIKPSDKELSSLMPYMLTRKEILNWSHDDILSAMNTSDVNKLANIEGLTKLKDVWKNIHYPDSNIETFF